MDNVLEKAALGRDFELGWLYDAHRDQVHPSKSLWSRKTRKDHSVKGKSNPFVQFEVVEGDEFDKKAEKLDISAELKLSFMAGLVEVKGSGHYLKNQKTSSKVERVSLVYKRTVRSDTLQDLGRGSADHLSRREDLGSATHVVTRIQYGNSIQMVYERKVAENEDNTEVQGKLAASIKGAGFSASGKAEFRADSVDTSYANTCNITYHGDVQPEGPLVTFKDALKFWADLPALLIKKNDDSAVPVRVTLTPVSQFLGGTDALLHAIEDSAINEATRVLAYLDVVTAQVKGLKTEFACRKVAALQKTVREFEQVFKTYTLEVQNKLKVVLPQIRSGKEDVTSLLELARAHEKSPFCEGNVTEWMRRFSLKCEYIVNQAALVDEKNVLFAKQRLTLTVANTKARGDRWMMVMYVIVSSVADDPLLEAMDIYNDTKKYDRESKLRIKVKNDEEFSIADQVSEKLTLVGKIVEDNVETVDFFVLFDVAKAHNPDGPTIDARVEAWHRGKKHTDDLQIPDELVNLRASAGSGGLVLKWDLPNGITMQSLTDSGFSHFAVDSRSTQIAGDWAEGTWEEEKACRAELNFGTKLGFKVIEQTWSSSRIDGGIALSAASTVVTRTKQDRIYFRTVAADATFTDGNHAFDVKLVEGEYVYVGFAPPAFNGGASGTTECRVGYKGDAKGGYSWNTNYNSCYHNGSRVLDAAACTQLGLTKATAGDTIRCELDLDAGTVSFGKNDKAKVVCFRGVQGPLSPAVSMYENMTHGKEPASFELLKVE